MSDHEITTLITYQLHMPAKAFEVNWNFDKCKTAHNDLIQDLESCPAYGIDSFARSQIIKTIVTSCVNHGSINGLWLFDSNKNELTIKDRSSNKNSLNLSVEANELYPSAVNLCHYLDFKDDKTWSIDDNNLYSFTDNTNDKPFSIILLISPKSSSNNWLLGKGNIDTEGVKQLEYGVSFDSNNYLNFILYKADGTAQLGRRNNSSLVGDIDSWHVYILTYSGNKFNSGLNIYRDGVNIDSVDVNIGTYAGMTNTDSKITNYRDLSTDYDQVGSHKYGLVSIINEELTSSRVSTISKALLGYIGTL